MNPESRSYHLFMQVTCLEMERVRRATERAAAARRIEEIDERIEAIDREKASLLAQLLERGDLANKSTGGAQPSPANAERPFRIHY